MIEVEIKFGFPLFSKEASLVNLGNNQKLIISDIWAFWDYVIKKRTSDRKERIFLQSLLEQAKHFYITAESSPVKSQPLLYYYSFLNFAKILININGGFGFNKTYMHGASEKHNNRFIHSEIMKQKQKIQLVQVAHELISLFEPNIPNVDISINVKSLLSHCIGIHRPYAEIYKQKEIFFKIEKYRLYKHGKQLIFNAEIKCDLSEMHLLNAQQYNLSENEDGNIIWSEHIIMSTYTPSRKDYAALSNLLRNKGIWYLIGNDGYTMYISNSATDRYSQESIIYMTMFYLGSITRYHPYMFDEIFSDKEQWLMSEFLNTQPKQFLYLATARVLGQSVLKAYASF
ncbi:YaaC family protein [Acinetobacter larvae]|uniref:Uncharacterized protein n=1 Tax=Acinetobacter larvae TaxID=1789224 RepID=A0A1B2LVX3_9GAMM|nr:YaaC family protein [Acinetobacter larvae]AOA57111.1 hypothetical protein BFG52_01260 [Acinetobacter larvae]